MTTPTVAVTCTANDQSGNPVAGARFKAKLNQTEIYGGFVVPELVEAIADASGVAVLNLWPNALGVAGSLYTVSASDPLTGKKFLNTTASVPNSPCRLHDILVQEPYPALDAAAQALIAAQGYAASADDDRVAAEIAAAYALTRSAAAAQSQFLASLSEKDAEAADLRVAQALLISPSAAALAANLAAPAGASRLGANAYQTQDAVNLEHVSVKRWGALVNGVQDDTVAIQAAINSNPGRLYFPPGTAIATSLSCPYDLVIYGAGDASVVKRKASTDTSSPSSASAALFSLTAHGKKITFRDIKLDGNEASQIDFQPYGYLIRFADLVGSASSKLSVTCDNVTFVDASQCCIAADGALPDIGLEELTVTNCRFINGRYGLAQGNVNVASPSGYGPDYIVLTDKVYATITGNSFLFDNVLAAGQFSRTAIRLTFATNTTNADGARALIDGNYFYGCGRGERADSRPGNDIGVIDAYARGRELRIVNNLFEESQGTPIRGKTNCDLVNIMGNVIDGTGMNPGINIGPNSYAQQVGRISVCNNTVRNTAGYAIGVVGNAGAVTGTANTQLYVADVLIADNVVEVVTSWNVQLGTTLGEGIYLRNFRNANVTGNMIGGVGLNGIYVRGTGGAYSSAHLNLSGNRVETATKGITFESTLVGVVTVMGNTVVSATSWAFDIQALSAGGAVLSYTNNSAIGAGDYGHYFRYWADAHIIGNHAEAVTGLSRGFYPQDSIRTKLAFNSVGAGVTTAFVGGGGAQSVNHDFGNTWNAKVMYGATLAPTVGTWAVGDVLYVGAPVAGGNIGWVCTTAGTPGTWKSFGAILA